MSEGYYTLKEAAQYFDVSVQTLRRWIKHGKLQAKMMESAYGPQYFIPSHQIQKAMEIQDVVKVDKTVEMAELVKVMSGYLEQREEAILTSIETLSNQITESIHQQEQLIKEVAATREENKKLLNYIEQSVAERDRKLMEAIRNLQEQRQQEQEAKRRWWQRKK